MSIVLFSFRSFMWFNDVPAGHFLIGIGGLIGLTSWFLFVRYNKAKKATQNIIKIEIEQNTEWKENLIWEFAKDYVRFKDYKYDLRIKWFYFKTYRVIDDHLFLDQNMHRTAAFIISKKEIGATNFVKVIALAKEKINSK